MDLSQAISGIAFLVFGIVMLLIGVFTNFIQGGFVSIIIGIPAFLIGIFILINKNENKIEQIKSERRRLR